jgi:hypothetical protein
LLLFEFVVPDDGAAFEATYIDTFIEAKAR